jgi:hypothetical protein
VKPCLASAFLQFLLEDIFFLFLPMKIVMR